MATGRKPKPTHLHLIEGTFRKERHNVRANEPKPASNLDTPPGWFSPEELATWDYGLRHAPTGLLKGIDASVYTVWVVATVTHRHAAEALARGGAKSLLSRTGSKPGTDKDGKPILVGGTVVQSPLVGIMNRAALILIRAAAELGFSPAARARVTAEGDAVADPEDRFFS